MNWNWQQPDWPTFTWSKDRLKKAEEQFLLGGGLIIGVFNHLDSEDQDHVRVQVLSEDGITTSTIEGELLDRDSVQSSVRRELGLQTDPQRSGASERGVAQLMVAVHQSPRQLLDKELICTWHALLLQSKKNTQRTGDYRTHKEPMRVISGRVSAPTVHFEAPPSSQVDDEMARFIEWYQRSGSSGSEPLPPLTRAGIAHLYFESIHPFEDGNGRIGRAISEKVLAEGIGFPTLTPLAPTILANQREYYARLAANSKSVDIDDWLAWFAAITLCAQSRTQAEIEFVVDKSKLLDRLRGELNARQEKVLLRALREGIGGFDGGLSAGNYIGIAKTSPATARRDLSDLVDKGAFTRTGERRHARYHLAIPTRPIKSLRIDPAGDIVERNTRTT